MGGVVSFLNLAYFGLRIWNSRIKPQSPASWLMWLVLELVILGSTIAAHKPIWLILSYVIGAVIVTFVLFRRGTWEWSWRESACAVLALVATYLWQNLGATVGILAGILAMTAAGIPLFLDMIFRPIRNTWSMWAWTAVACVFTLIGSDGTFEGSGLAWSGVIFNTLMVPIVLRGK